MVGTSSIAIFVIAAGTSMFMAWTIGAGSSGSTPFAPAVGANAISVMRAGFIVGILGFGGAVLQGVNVSEAVGKDLIVGATLSPTAAVVGLLTAAGLVAVGIYTGYPIATAFTVTGAIVGVGVALGGDLAWEKYREIVGLWIAIPFVGGSLAYATTRALKAEFVSDSNAVTGLAGLVGLVLANIEFVFFGPPGETASVAAVAARSIQLLPNSGISPIAAVVSLLLAAICAFIMSNDVAANSEAGQRHFLLALGGLVAFSAGGSQVGLAIGPLLPLQDTLSIPLGWLLVGGGLGLLVGSWTGAPRMIKAISQDYCSLGPRRSIAALVPSFLIAQTAILYGIPVSFNEIIVSAIVGSGYAGGEGSISRRKVTYTVVAWIGSFVLALTVSYGLYSAIVTL